MGARQDDVQRPLEADIWVTVAGLQSWRGHACLAYRTAPRPTPRPSPRPAKGLRSSPSPPAISEVSRRHFVDRSEAVHLEVRCVVGLASEEQPQSHPEV